MQATHSSVFALKNSGLDAFLYADVGAELNGSALTVLSMLARLGQDPWAEAASWAALPRAHVIDNLVQSIARMPLVPAALAGSRATAERLVQLLPAAAQRSEQGRVAKSDVTTAPKWLPITMLYCAVAVGMALNTLMVPKPAPAVATLTEQPTAASNIPGSTSAPHVIAAAGSQAGGRHSP